MKHISPLKRFSAFLLIATGLLVLAATVQADAVNKKRVLKKAGGPVDGTLTQVMCTTYPFGGGDPIVEHSFDREGEAKIPKKKGKASSDIEHVGEEEEPGEYDSTTGGKVKKAQVKRGGKLIKYKGEGATEPIFDEEDNLQGSINATSKVKGKKVKSSGTTMGARYRLNGDYEICSGVVTGTSKY